MGARNFAIGNTSKVFAVLMDEERTFKECSECEARHYDYEYSEESFTNLCECENGCEDATLEEKTEYESPDDWAYDDLKYYIRETAEERVKELPYKYSEEDGCGNERQYTSNELFSYYVSKSFGDIEVEIKIIAQIVSAYYEGASLDFEVYIYNGGEWVALSNGYYKITEADILHDLFDIGYESYNSDMNQGLRKIQSKNALKWAEKETEKLKNLVEEVFTKVSMPLVITAQFSNGETHYAKI